MNAPLSCPNNSLSIKFGLIAAQLTSSKGLCNRLLALCMVKLRQKRVNLRNGAGKMKVTTLRPAC